MENKSDSGAKSKSDAGVLYIAFGKVFIDEAVFSARSLKALCPDLNTTLFADSDPGAACFDNFRNISAGHKRCKVDFISESPYRDTLYLDSDTKIVFPIEEMFSVLDQFDFAACHDFSRKRKHWSDRIKKYAEIPYAFPEYNGGVILFRKNERTDAFFEKWRSLYYEYRTETDGWDQPSLRMALWESTIRLHTMPPEFNVRSRAMQKRAHDRGKNPETRENMHPRILHWHKLDRPLKLFFKRKYRMSRY